MKINPLIPIAAIGWYFMTRETLARRNNNPLNIRYNRHNKWDGQVGEGAGGFAKFSSPVYGFRAGAKLLDNYRKRYGIDTVDKILNRFAPASENPHLDRYKHYVAKQLGIPVKSKITKGDYPVMLRAMGKFESGEFWPQDIIDKGISLS